MNRSPAKIIELCIYVLIIIAAIIWMFTGRKLYTPPATPAPAVTQTAPPETATPPIMVPKGEVFPEP